MPSKLPGAVIKKHKEWTAIESNTKIETQRKNPGGTDKNEHRGHDDHTAHLRGNIGTTRTQEMVSDEWNLRTELDFYRMVADKYAHEMLLMIY